MENSIEEDIKIVENYLANSAINEIESNFFKNGGWETVDLEIPKSMQHILSDYRRVLKENEILKKEKEQAWEEWNNLEQGSYETEQKLKQQIKESQRENEELKNNGVIDENGFEFAVDCDWDRLKRLIDTADKSEEFILYNNEKWIKEKYCIPIQKVKNKIEELENAYWYCENVKNQTIEALE